MLGQCPQLYSQSYWHSGTEESYPKAFSARAGKRWEALVAKVVSFSLRR